MDLLDSLMDMNIDCKTAALVNQLLEQHAPGLAPCAIPLANVLDQLEKEYPITVLPAGSIHHARTALAVIEAHFPEDADYLPYDPEERNASAWSLSRTLRLNIRCMEIADEGTGHTLYKQQQAQFEQRTAGFGLKWIPMPIRICAETTTGYCLVTGSDPLRDRILCLRGVSQEDIDTCSPALIAYLRAAHGSGAV
ncbi:MAG: hypothetical protein Q4P20_05990 [Eubacteriales bacterium]|nr:hypothetical protein [Eubacteriales bacterium]